MSRLLVVVLLLVTSVGAAACSALMEEVVVTTSTPTPTEEAYDCESVRSLLVDFCHSKFRLLLGSGFCPGTGGDPLACTEWANSHAWPPEPPLCESSESCPITDIVARFAWTDMGRLREYQAAGCPLIDPAAPRCIAEQFLLGQRNVPEDLKRQLLPATTAWLAATDPQERSTALEEMSVAIKLYQVASPPQQPVVVVVPRPSQSLSSSSDWPSLDRTLMDIKVRELEQEIEDLNRRVGH